MWHWAQPGDDAVPWERAYQVPLTPEAVGRKRICSATLSEPAGRSRRELAARYCRRSCCIDCSRSGRWSSADRSTVRRLLRPHVQRVGRSMAAAVEMVRTAQVRDHPRAAALCALPARVRAGLLGRRADRAARRGGATASPPPTSSVAALDATHRRLVDAGCRERVTLLQRVPRRALAVDGMSIWSCCRRSATTSIPACCARSWTARCRGCRGARPCWPRIGAIRSPTTR